MQDEEESEPNRSKALQIEKNRKSNIESNHDETEANVLAEDATETALLV